MVSSGWLIADAISVAFMIVYPIVVAIWVHRRLKVGWRYFGYGALIFFLFQLVTRVPAIQITQAALAPRLRSEPALLWGWLLVAALTAGLFEEVGRYVGYRWLMRGQDKTWSRAVMYGVGHGGLEAWFTAVLAGTTLINVIVLSQMGLTSVPPAARAQVAQQFAVLNAQPIWFPLLGAWERLWTLPVQVGLSVLVLQVFRQGSLRWLWLAILAHTFVDFTAIALGQVTVISPIPRTLLIEGLVAVFGIIGLLVIRRFRDEVISYAPPAQSEHVCSNEG